MMDLTGPPIERLTHRLAETPADFLGEPQIGTGGRVAVAALVADLLARFGGRAEPVQLARFVSDQAPRDRNRLALVMIAVWLLADDWFAGAGIGPGPMAALLDSGVEELAVSNPAHQFVHDPDRREELARTVLARLGLRPAGESEAQAADRLTAISGAERQRLLNASRAAEERAREVREALARQAAQESADKWTRE
ncbi:MAG: hypothetical protein RL367_1060 [Pseudomonadota bacterium]|jgi:hypothetical protein